MKFLILSFLIFLPFGCNKAEKNKKLSSLEILSIPSVELDYPDEIYYDILWEKFPEAKLKDLLLKILIVFDDFNLSFDYNCHLNSTIDILYHYSKSNKISDDLVPILIYTLDKHLYIFENTLNNAKLLKKITKIDVGWDENYVKNWTGSKEDRVDLLFKISKWQKWVVEHNVRDLISKPLSSIPNKKDSLPINKILQLEDSEELIQAYSNLAIEENALSKIISILEIPNNNGRKIYLHRYYAIEALYLFSQDHPIPVSIVPLLISHFKGGSYFSAKKTCAKLLKKLTNLDVGWEKNYYNQPNKLFCNDCEDLTKKWEDWEKVNITK